jgi:hypothetical protein
MASPYKANATISKGLQSYLPAAANPKHVSALLNGMDELNRKSTPTFVGDTTVRPTPSRGCSKPERPRRRLPREVSSGERLFSHWRVSENFLQRHQLFD